MASEHLRGCPCGPPWAQAPAAPAAVATGATALRVVSYNLHSGLGPKLAMSRPRGVVERNLRAVARVIVGDDPKAAAPDVVGLNEVDFAARRSGGLDQAAFLASELERRTGHAYGVVRGVTWERRTPGFEVKFGNAVLVRHPIVRSEAVRFDAGSASADTAGVPSVRSPLFLDRFVREARGLVKATIATPAGEVDLLVTHLDAFAQAEREAQAVHLLRHVVHGRTTVLLGDLNAVPTPLTVGRRFFEDDLTHDLLTSGPLVDARVMIAARHGSPDLKAWATFPAATPVWPLDGVLGTHDLVPSDAKIIGVTESDHRGIAVDYRVTRDPDAVRQVRAWHDAVRLRQLAHIDGCGGDDEVHRASVAPGAHDTRAGRRRRLLAVSGFSDLSGKLADSRVVDHP